MDPQPTLKMDINNASQHYSLLPYIPLGDGHFVKYMFIHGLLGLLHGVCNSDGNRTVPSRDRTGPRDIEDSILLFNKVQN